MKEWKQLISDINDDIERNSRFHQRFQFSCMGAHLFFYFLGILLMGDGGWFGLIVLANCFTFMVSREASKKNYHKYNNMYLEQRARCYDKMKYFENYDKT
jgi:hypothetical protein